MKKIFKPFIFGLLTLVASAGVYFNQTNIISFNSDDVVVTEKQEATHTSNYSDYTYSGSYYDSIDITSLTNNVGGTLRKALTSLAYPKGWHEYYTDATGTLSDKLQKSDADPDNNSNMIYFYTRNSVAKTYSNGGSSWNREHVWCQSLSGSSSSSSNNLYGESYGGSDIHHIRPAIGSYNSLRSNAAFGVTYGPKSGMKTIAHENGGYNYITGNVIEPVDEIKGDIARIVMYMYMHYSSSIANDGSKYSFLGTMNIHFIMAPNRSTDCFKMLRDWNAIDPVDDYERNRNEVAFRKQGNRNPFIDHPSYADKIWG